MLQKLLFQFARDPILQPTYQEKVFNIARSNLIGFWPLSDPSGTRAIDLSPYAQRADYSTTAIQYGAQGILPGQKAIAMSGVSSYVNIMTSVNSFDTLWSGNNFTKIGWGQVDGIARWSDPAAFRYITHIRTTDNTYYAVMGKNQTANQLEWRRRTGGAVVAITYTFPVVPVDWFAMGLSFTLTPTPLLKAFLWDSITGWRIVGSSSNAALTDWGSNLPVEGSSVLGAGSLTAQHWIGKISNCAIWNTTLPDSVIQQAMTPY